MLHLWPGYIYGKGRRENNERVSAWRRFFNSAIWIGTNDSKDDDSMDAKNKY